MAAKKKNTNANVHPLANVQTMRPEDLATKLGLSGKVVRSYLRRTFPRPIESKGSTWVLTNEQATNAYDHFIAKRSPVQPSA